MFDLGHRIEIWLSILHQWVLFDRLATHWGSGCWPIPLGGVCRSYPAGIFLSLIKLS